MNEESSKKSKTKKVIHLALYALAVILIAWVILTILVVLSAKT